MLDQDAALRSLSRMRWRIAVMLTVVMLVVYFGFIALTALGKGLMGTLLASGLSVGMLLGALVIVSAFALTGIYVRWANVRYDPELHQIRQALSNERDSRTGGTP